MPTTRIKQKLSKLVPSQLPEFIRNDYPLFVAFLKAYYEYLEQDQYAQELIQNAKEYNDIDYTVDSFIQYFLKQYGDSVPRTQEVDPRLVVKQLKYLYNNKGNTDSYKLFFALLFNKEASVVFPSRQVLRASDGRWVRNTSIFLETISGDPSTIENQVVTLVTLTSKLQLQVLRKRSVTALINGVAQVSPTVNEFFIDDSKNFNIQPGDVIEGATFKGIVRSVPTSVSIVDPGTGFKPGSIFSITSGNGIGSLVKVIKTSTTGALQVVQLISFGLGYEVDFYAYLSAESLQAITETDVIVAGNNVLVNDKMAGIVDYGFINFSDYTINAWDATYVGTLAGTFSSDTGQLTGSTVDGSILITVGGKTRYPGYYETNYGFLSDEIYIQDDGYYQPYSYLVKIEERLSSYKTALLDLLHPAGTKLFADYSINNTINIDTQVLQREIKFNTLLKSEELDLIELTSFNISKNISGSDDIAVDDPLSIYTVKGTFEEPVPVTDDTPVITVTQNVPEPITFEDLYALSLTQTFNFKSFDVEYYDAEEYAVSGDDPGVADSISVVLNPP